MLVRRQRKNVVDNHLLARQLSLETLEDRRMLATMFVNDLGDGTLGSQFGDGKLSLREAVAAINFGAPVDGIQPSAGVFGVGDVIRFEAEVFGGVPHTLSLVAGHMLLEKEVAVAGPGASLLTIDAQQNSRIFDVDEGGHSVTIADMTLTGGWTSTQGQAGGAIRSLSTGDVILNRLVITDNATTGNASNGGAISALGSVTINSSQITNNRTEQSGGGGGGVFALGDVELTRSTIADNRTEGAFASGGGVSANGKVTVNSSTVSGNRTMGAGSAAGGILAFGDIDLTESTVSGNQTVAPTASGGGVSSAGVITVTRSTIVDNRAFGASATGGGVQTVSTDINVSGSIIANNFAGGGNLDIQPGTGMLSIDHSLVRDITGLAIPPDPTNVFLVDPQLGPLSGGGQTATHAPLPGSPVIDAGDALIALPPTNDQRGAPFARVADGDGNTTTVIDMGSHEVQAPATADFDSDGDVDGADFLSWQRGVGVIEGAVRAEGNADEDGDVDNQDLAVWDVQFGDVGLPISAPAIQQLSTDRNDARAQLIDLAIAVELGTTKPTDSELVSLETPTFFAEDAPREQAFAAIAAPVRPATNLGVSPATVSSQASTADDGQLVEKLIVVTL